MTTNSFTDIFDAARRGTVDDVRHFVEEKGADVNAKDQHGFTPLFAAISENENIEVFKYLRSHGATVKGEGGCDADLLILAKEMGNTVVVEYLTPVCEDMIKMVAKMTDGAVVRLDDFKELEAVCMKVKADRIEGENIEGDEAYDKMIESICEMIELHQKTIELHQKIIEKYQKAIDR
jgi:hypothetical protein